jgi:hypothetical protein
VKACTAILVGLTFVTLVNAQIPKVSPSPTVDQILENYISALGGRAAISKISTRVSKGTLTLVDVLQCVDLEIYVKLPYKFADFKKSACLPNMCVSCNGFNGLVYWNDDMGKDGLSVGKVEDDFWHNNESQREFKAHFFEYNPRWPIEVKEIFPNLAFAGRLEINGRGVYRVEVPEREYTWYFDTKTGLLVAERYIGELGFEMEDDYLDYRKVDGVKVPFIQRTFRLRGSLVRIIRWNEIRHNVEIDERTFDPPPKHKSVLDMPEIKPLISYP